MDKIYKICFYAPVSHVEEIKNAMFACGGGNLGTYSHCSFQVLGEGQFMPLTGSQAYIGKINQVEKIQEYKVEMACTEDSLQKVMAAFKKAHPYELPAYEVTEVKAFQF